MLIKNQQDFWAGIFFMAFGAGAALVAQENALGTLSRMGPGYFPTILGVILIILGFAVSLRAVLAKSEANDIEKVHWKVLFFVLGSVAVFAMTLLHLGIVLSLALLIAISTLASGRFRVKEVLILSAFMCFLCWGIFVFGVGLQVPVIPVFF